MIRREQMMKTTKRVLSGILWLGGGMTIGSMTQTTQATQTAHKRSAGVVKPGIGSGVPLIGDPFRHRSRRAVSAKGTNDDISPQRIRQDRGSDAARSSMEAGITRGVSVLFGEFGSRR